MLPRLTFAILMSHLLQPLLIPSSIASRPSDHMGSAGGYQKVMKKTAKEIDNIFEGWLEEHQKRQRVSGEHQFEGEHDFMNVFLSILEDTSKQEFTGFNHDTMIKATGL
ncbi:hypothetical protein Tco_1234338, partial [Tanacetum coccineum]